MSPTAGASPRVPLPPRTPSIIYAACPDNSGAPACAAAEVTSDGSGGFICADPNGCIWLASHDPFARAHELGHIFDAQVLADRDRARFRTLLGFHPERPWVSDDPYAASPAEVFADMYALCRLNITPWGHRHGRTLIGSNPAPYAKEPSPGRYRRVCAAIRFVALG